MLISKSVSSIAVVVLLVLCIVAATFSPSVQATDASKAAVTASPTVGASAWNIETVRIDGDVGTWSTWESLNGHLTASPGTVSWGTGHIDVFGRGSNGALYQKTYDNSAWSGWTSLGGQLASTTGPAVSSQAAGQLDVFVIGMNNALWHRSYVTVAGTPTRINLYVYDDGPALNTETTFYAELYKWTSFGGYGWWDYWSGQSVEFGHYENGVWITDFTNTTQGMSAEAFWHAPGWPTPEERTYYVYFGGDSTYASSLSKGVTVKPNATTSVGCAIPLTTPEGETYTINGTLKDHDGRGLAYMTVYIVGDVNAILTTDESGYFSTTAISRGNCMLCYVCVHSEFHGEGYYLGSTSYSVCGIA